MADFMVAPRLSWPESSTIIPTTASWRTPEFYNYGMRLLIAALFILGLQNPQAGVLEGVVTRASSAQPVEGARVALRGDAGPDFETRTDANGHYVFPDLPPGVYNIEVQADGFIPLPNPWSNVKFRLAIDPQERLRQDVKLTSGGTINGRVLNENREPVPGLDVEILQLGYDSRGRGVWQVFAMATTNNAGEYRAEGLPPADYYVRASKKFSKDSSDLAATYFPGTADPRSAAPVHLQETGETAAVFSLARENAYSIEGNVTSPDSQVAATSELLIFAIPQDSKIPLDPLSKPGTAAGSAQSGWNFKLSGLLPGVYDVFAVGVSPTPDKPGRIGATTIDIRDSNLNGVRLSLDPGVDVKGRIRVTDDNGVSVTLEAYAPIANPLDLTSGDRKARVSLSLNRKEVFPAGFVSVSPSVNGDTFVFANVPAGPYDVVLRETGPSSDFYVADIRESGRSIFDEGLVVRGTPVDFLEVVVGFDGGRIEGSVTGNRGTPVFVVLAPHASRRQNGALYKTMQLTDFSKPFRFTGVAPGLYSIFAFEVGALSETVPYRNADFLSRYENQGMPVTVERGTTVGPVQVPLITP
jgi:hypothetical protein